MDEELLTAARFRATDAGDRGIDEPRVQIGVRTVPPVPLSAALSCAQVSRATCSRVHSRVHSLAVFP
jgi:hypothetical protein